MYAAVYLLHGQYGEPAICRAIPLGIALCFTSNSHLHVTDCLNKYFHDSDVDVAHSAIFSMGLVEAGTNNAKVIRYFNVFKTFTAIFIDISL
jgi:hypothetical protein